MGLLKHLLFWPVTGPTFLTRFSLEKVGDTVREELTNDEAIREDLLALQMRLELGEIDDEEYLREESALMQRLREVREWREELGMGTAGGPVRVAGAGATADMLISAKDEAPPLADEAASVAPSPEVLEADEQTSSDRLDRPSAGGLASPEGARVEIRLDWD